MFERFAAVAYIPKDSDPFFKGPNIHNLRLRERESKETVQTNDRWKRYKDKFQSIKQAL